MPVSREGIPDWMREKYIVQAISHQPGWADARPGCECEKGVGKAVMAKRFTNAGMGRQLASEVERITQEYLGPSAARDVSDLAPEEREEFFDYLQDELGIVLDEDQMEALTQKPRLRMEDVIAAFRQAGEEGEGANLYDDELDF